MCSSYLHPPRGRFEANRCSLRCHRHPTVCEMNCRLGPWQHGRKEEAPFRASSSSPRIRTSNLAVRESIPVEVHFNYCDSQSSVLRLNCFSAMILLHLIVTVDPQGFAFMSHPSGARCIGSAFGTRTTLRNWRICAIFASVRRSALLENFNRNWGTCAILPGENLALPFAY
jgi:hypothetical protein